MRPATWTKQQLIEMYAEIQKNRQSIKNYTDLNKISYYKLYQAFRRYNVPSDIFWKNGDFERMYEEALRIDKHFEKMKYLRKNIGRIITLKSKYMECPDGGIFNPGIKAEVIGIDDEEVNPFSSEYGYTFPGTFDIIFIIKIKKDNISSWIIQTKRWEYDFDGIESIK